MSRLRKNRHLVRLHDHRLELGIAVMPRQHSKFDPCLSEQNRCRELIFAEVARCVSSVMFRVAGGDPVSPCAA